jgi:hypothetical protein
MAFMSVVYMSVVSMFVVSMSVVSMSMIVIVMVSVFAASMAVTLVREQRHLLRASQEKRREVAETGGGVPTSRRNSEYMQFHTGTRGTLCVGSMRVVSISMVSMSTQGNH